MIDAETTPRLEGFLKKAAGRPKPLTLLRFAEVDYVNSSGMGLLIKHADLHQAAGGTLALLEVSPKTLALFRMLGLLSVLKTYPGQPEALADLQGLSSRPEPAAPPPAPAAPPSARVPEPEPKGPYPLAQPCPTCRATMEFPEPGFYKCGGCGTAFRAEAGGSVQPFRSGSPVPFEASLPYDAELLEGVWAVAARSADQAGLSGAERDAFLGDLRRAAGLVVSRGKGKGRTLRVLLASGPGECLAGLRTDVPVANGSPDPEFAPFEVIEAAGGHFLKCRRLASTGSS